MLSRLDRLAYHSQHLSFLINATVMEEAARLVTRNKRGRRSTTRCGSALQRRRSELHRRDLDERRRRALSARAAVRLSRAPLPARVPAAHRRCAARRAPDAQRTTTRTFPHVDKERFPPYYRRTFHWQTDGYFSDHSAEVYELGVELLFRGTADVMRRQIIPPITELVRAVGRRRRQRQAARHRLRHRPHAAPARAHASDDAAAWRRSVAGVHQASRANGSRDVEELTLAVENAEALPWADATFDVVTSIYLFHELPRNARRNVVREMLRVVKPGGLVVIEDSAQLVGEPGARGVLAQLPARSSTSRSTRITCETISGRSSTTSASVDVLTQPGTSSRRSSSRRRALTERVRTCASRHSVQPARALMPRNRARAQQLRVQYVFCSTDRSHGR